MLKKLFLFFILIAHATAKSSVTAKFKISTELILKTLALEHKRSTFINVCSCPVPPQVIPIPLPNLLIKLQNYLGTTINSYTFLTNSNFKSRIAILTIQIFPPTNIVTTDKIITLTNQNSYAILYTLQSPDGLYFQQEIQYATTTGQAPILPIINGFPTIPTALTISKTNGTLLNTTTISNNSASLPSVTQQQLLNSISPITQKFLLTTNSLGLLPAIVPLSGSYDPNSNLTTPAIITTLIPSTTSVIPPIQPTTNPNSTNFIPPIYITLYNGSTPYLLTLTPANIELTETDLINGVIMNLYIYPPLYQNGLTANTFTFAITLQTFDGLKFVKTISQAVPFTNYPITFKIVAQSLEGNVTTLTSNIANPSLTAQTYNMLSPFNIKMILQQNTSNVVGISIL